MEGTKEMLSRSQETCLWCGFRKWATNMCNLPLHCYMFILSCTDVLNIWNWRPSPFLHFTHWQNWPISWWVLQGRNVPEPFTARHRSTGCFDTHHNFRYKSWNVGKLPFEKEFASFREVLTETGKIGFIRKIQDFLWDIFVVEGGNLAKQELLMRKCLFQSTCQEMLWKQWFL